MPTHNASNERIKRQYFTYLKEAERNSEATVDAAAAALSRFETDTKFRDFKAFHHQQAIAFKRRLAGETGKASGEPLSKATLNSTMVHLKRFFRWLAGQPGYKSRLKYTDSEYFNLSEKEVRVASARRERPVPTLEQVRHVVAIMPSSTEIERRNRALVAFSLLTGARDSAIASFKLKHIDLDAASVYQDAREVKTKFSKTFTTVFFPVGLEVVGIVIDWVTYLRAEKGWDNEDPLFPTTQVAAGPDRNFTVTGIKREHWQNAGPIRRIFSEAFKAAGLQYFNPHSLRNTLVRLGETLCQTPEDFKAWSQNLGHEKILTTFMSYGSVDSRRQREIIKGLGRDRDSSAPDAVELAEQLARTLRRTQQAR